MNQVRYGMYLEQNIYRQDSLLALPKGIKLRYQELEFIQKFNLDYLLIADNPKEYTDKKNITVTLQIIESAFRQNTILKEEFSTSLYEDIERKIKKSKRIQQYLNELRLLDSYSFAHCINISIVMAVLLSKEQEYDKGIGNIVFLALLHDIGRIKMPNIFGKEGQLDDEEFMLLMKHPEYSFDLLRKAGFSQYDIFFVMETHERYDGGGYPKRLKGEEISEMAQLILICDIYNALSSYRPHRPPFDPYQVSQIIESETNKTVGELYVKVFLERFTPYRLGCKVELNNGMVGIVRKLPEDRKILPIIEVLGDEDDEVVGRGQIVDLQNHRELNIVKILETY